MLKDIENKMKIGRRDGYRMRWVKVIMSKQMIYPLINISDSRHTDFIENCKNKKKQCTLLNNLKQLRKKLMSVTKCLHSI